jgi:hypothetical protein
MFFHSKQHMYMQHWLHTTWEDLCAGVSGWLHKWQLYSTKHLHMQPWLPPGPNWQVQAVALCILLEYGWQFACIHNL